MRKETQGALFYGVGRNRKEDPMDYRSVQIDPSANIAPDCSILGHVTIGPDVTVFSGAATNCSFPLRDTTAMTVAGCCGFGSS